MDTLQVPAFDAREATRLCGSRSQDDGIKLFLQPIGGIVLANFSLGQEGNSFLLHQLDTPVHQLFGQLHVRDAVSE